MISRLQDKLTPEEYVLLLVVGVMIATGSAMLLVLWSLETHGPVPSLVAGIALSAWRLVAAFR